MVCCHSVATVIEGLLLLLWDQCRSLALSYTLCTHEDAHRDPGITSCISRCRLAAGFVVSKTKDGGFCLLGLAATCTFSCNILYKRTVGTNLCLSPGSPRRYHSHGVAVHFRRCSPGLGWLYCRVNLTWLFHTGLFL